MLGGLLLEGCGSSKPAESVTVTVKKDGSRFSGTVVRREANSITLTDSYGSVRTFLYTEILDIKNGLTESPATGASGQTTTSTNIPAGASSAPATHSSGSSAKVTSTGFILPPGTELPVVSSGFFDSCCVERGSFAPGKLDADVQSEGRVVIPRGANVTVMLMDVSTSEGRTTVRFELGALDFGGRHYIMRSVKGEKEPGAVATYTGAKDGSMEAKTHGLNVHVDEGSLMPFKTALPTEVSLSQ